MEQNKSDQHMEKLPYNSHHHNQIWGQGFPFEFLAIFVVDHPLYRRQPSMRFCFKVVKSNLAIDTG